MRAVGSPEDVIAGGTRMTLLAQALAVVLLAPAAAVAASPACDEAGAVETVRTEAARQGRDVSTLQLVSEGPYDSAKFMRTHPTFRTSPALKRKLAKRTVYFVWFHPPFTRAGARGTDVWGLVDADRCGLLHLARDQ
jgi:hypothetical protein